VKLTTQLHTVARLWTRGAVSPLHQHFRLKGELNVTHLYNQWNPVQSTPDIASPSQTSSVCEQIPSNNAFRFNAAFDMSSPPTHKMRRANSIRLWVYFVGLVSNYTARGNICKPSWLCVVVLVTPQTSVKNKSLSFFSAIIGWKLLVLVSVCVWMF